MSTPPNAFVIIVGKSCETQIVLAPLLTYLGSECQVIHDSSNLTNTQHQSVIFTDVDLFEQYKNHYNTSIVIVNELNAYRLKTMPENNIYTIVYNTDKVSVSLRILLLAKSMSLPKMFTRIDAISVIASRYTKVMLWSRAIYSNELPANVINSVNGATIERDVMAILFYDTPTVDEYYEFVRKIIVRSNYQDRAKQGVNVKVYCITQNTSRQDVDQLLRDVTMRISAVKHLVSLATKQIVTVKGGSIAFEDRVTK